ncbi:MAG TPA: LPS export ABC transporter periplasmic protein LptC [Woeseiaceae bacterium]|nr:LPS export ABC transporter periplasmic protein LptC [Woeseiaceae bacterium]
MLTARNTIGIALLLAAAFGTWYLAASVQREAPPATPGGTLQTGYYLKSARILGTGEQGKLLYEIEAEYAEQQSDDEIAFDKVRIRYTPTTAVPWTLSADKAWITGDQERLTLSGHVLAISSAGFSGRITEFRTDWLELEPENYKAETDERVQIRVGERSLTATGMVAQLRDNRLQLKSNVSGKFVP